MSDLIIPETGHSALRSIRPLNGHLGNADAHPDLAGLRMELPAVFRHAHARIGAGPPDDWWGVWSLRYFQRVHRAGAEGRDATDGDGALGPILAVKASSNQALPPYDNTG